MMIGIYLIINKKNNHLYIGQSNNIKRRWIEHCSQYKHKDTVLSRAIKKHGIDNFEFSILEECLISELDEKEKYYIKLLKPTYNMNNGGNGNGGRKFSDELRNKFSVIGKNVWSNYSDEHKNFIIKNNLKGPTKGKPRSLETKLKLSNKTKDYFRSIGGMPQSTKKKISKSNSKVMIGNTNGNKKVDQINKITGEIIQTFDSIKEAAEFINVHPSNITKVCSGNQKSAGGYYWKFTNNIV